MPKPTLTVALPNYGQALPADKWHEFIDLACAAEGAGVDRVVVVDHVVMGPNPQSYPWGRFPTGSDAPWLEPLTILAAIASRTQRVRLMTCILIAPLRPAALLAKQAATLDVLSRGRLDLGVGTGWQREEYEAQGLDFEQRGQLLTDTIAACNALWRTTPTYFESPTLSLHDIYCVPKPVQPGGVPVWIGGTLHRRNMERIIREGAGWIPIMRLTLAKMAEGVDAIREAWQAAGRDPAGLQVQGRLPIKQDQSGHNDLARSIEAVPELTDAGATDIYVPVSAFWRNLTDARSGFKELVRRFDDVAT